MLFMAVVPKRDILFVKLLFFPPSQEAAAIFEIQLPLVGEGCTLTQTL
jgi:hypothetical protein